MSRIMNEKDGIVEVNVARVEEWRDMAVDAIASDVERDVLECDEVSDVALEECNKLVDRLDRVAVPIVAHDMYGMSRDDVTDVRDFVHRMVRDVVVRVDDRVEGGVR